jgi:hypothetical protein
MWLCLASFFRLGFHEPKGSHTSDGLMVFLSSEIGRLIAIGLLAIVLNVVAFLRFCPLVWTGHLFDPDSYMILVRVAQEIQTGHITDVVLRDQSGHGVSIAWTHLMDATIFLASLPFMPFLTLHSAVYACGVVAAELMVGLLAAGIAYAVSPMTNGRFLGIAPFVIECLAGIRSYAILGSITHHIAFLAAVAFCLGHAFRSLDGSLRHAAIAGILGAVAIGITPETGPFVLVCFSVVASSWVQGATASRIIWLAAGNFAATVIVLIVDIPAGDLDAPWIDGPSMVFVAFSIILVVEAIVISAVERHLVGWRTRLATLSGLSVLGGIIWVGLYPGLLNGINDGVPAAVAGAFYGSINEMQPIHGMIELSAFLGPGFLVTLVALAAYVLERDWRYGLFAIVSIAACNLAVHHVRFTEWSSTIAALALPVILANIWDYLDGRAVERVICVSLAGIGIIILPLMPAYAINPQVEKQFLKIETASDSCSTDKLSELLKPYAGKIVLASPNFTPELLWRTHVVTTGSLYSRGAWGFIRTAEAWNTPSLGDKEPLSLAQTGAQFVLYCPVRGDNSKPDNAVFNIQNALQYGMPPSWMTFLWADPSSGFVFYKVNNPPRVRIVGRF